MRGIYIPLSVIPNDLKQEFDQIETSAQINNNTECSGEIKNMVMRWELYADGSPSYYDILFGIDYNDENNEKCLPEWYRESILYYQNHSDNRSDMSLKIFDLFNILKKNKNVTRAILSYDKATNDNSIEKTLYTYLYK